jgi:hypothetical protein
MLLRCTRLLLFVWLLVSTAAAAASRSPDLDTWVMDELTPYLAETLAAHPRFRNEAVRFVVMQDGNPQAHPSALALALRNQVQDALVDTPGIRIAWQPDRIDINRESAKQRIDCTADEVHYYIGIEVTEEKSGRFGVGVRALDLEERSWVGGFGHSWQGMLTSMQHRAWQQYEADPSFRGDREAPYLESQSDLLAAHLAHDLGCSLLRQVAGEYRVGPRDGDDTPASADAITELVSNNLAYYRALQFAGESAEANASVEGKAHRIDDDLYQYWITVRPNDSAAELPALSASAYIYLPEEFVAASLVTDDSEEIHTAGSDVLTSMQLVEFEKRPSWYALQTETAEDAVLFYLNYQQGNGLARLGGPSCERHTTVRVSRAGERLQFGLPLDTMSAPRWLPASHWEAEPDEDSYWIIAVADSQAAWAIARHVKQLPARCASSMRPGLDGRPLRSWLHKFTDLEDRWASSVDWQIIRVRSVY